jgi:hypothetical protein
MALNLSTLTSPATSGDVLAEALTTADFLEPVPVLRNLARGSNKGGDAEQDVALNQPKALPLIDGDGYFYCSGINGNYANTPDDSSLDITGDLVIDVDVTMKSWTPTSNSSFCGKYQSIGDQRSFRFLLRPDKRLQLYFSDDGTGAGLTGAAFSTAVPFADGQRGQVRVSFDSSTGIAQFFTSIDKGATWTQLGPDKSTGKFAIYAGTAEVYVGAYSQNSELLPHAGIHSVKFYDSVTPSSSSLRFNCDFTATNVRHGATKFQCATGQVVTINQSGNDPATIIKKPVLRFANQSNNTTGICLQGLLNQTITDGYMFAAFSVLGDGGEGWGRVFSVNSTGSSDAISTGFQFVDKYTTSNDLISYYNGNGLTHTDLFDEDNGDILVESKITSTGIQLKVNDNSPESLTVSTSLSAEEFNISTRHQEGIENPAIDLEYLALFPADSVPDEATASKIRNFINNRNSVFYRWDTDGFYFFDPQKATFTGNFTDANTLDGYITGSDNGDTDVRTNLTLVQPTLNDQPSTDGYKITFNDSAEHLEFENGASQSLAGWQIVGTSLGTFAYRVNANAVTELNLLGNLGNVLYRKSGDLYGIILLPTSATGREINEAKKLLTDRGASASATANVENAWRNRADIVQFDGGDMSDVTNAAASWMSCSSLKSFSTELPLATGVSNAWRLCSSLESFSTPLPLVTNANYAWNGCSSLSEFTTTDIKNCSNFTSAWQGTTALTSFPADAKLGTEVSNVNFSTAWQSSGLTSFSTPLPTATNAYAAWSSCVSLESFSAELPSVNNAREAWYNCSSLESFSVELPSVTNAMFAWDGCSSLTSFDVSLPSASQMYRAWARCSSLTDFSADVFSNWNPSSISSGVFDFAWLGCSSLTSQSVENILTSIDSTGHYATTNKLSGGTPLIDAGIDITYNGDPLSAATTAAITSLKSKGWSIFINSVEQ